MIGQLEGAEALGRIEAELAALEASGEPLGAGVVADLLGRVRACPRGGRRALR